MSTDYDPVIICPYDANHRIAKSRIQRHLVKCEKNFPPNYKKQCPYDASHRIFEHELMEHMQKCPMKYQCPFELGQSKSVSSEILLQEEVEPNNDEVWDEDLPIDSDISNLGSEFDFEHSSMKSMFVVKHFKKKLRPPHGYSESRMIETSDLDLSKDEDTISVTSDKGIGRGRNISGAYSGQYQRGTGIRGRLRH
ncbi:gametocyte-specific factor 1-like isoform X2 [Phymastichus coffea]|uniref:gametocyte-specific factor 1-like isoform X2 n=1 Tax=Phymastichus coffea TaxID=108790 RepID=UPI00273B6874|nr:gametocyte-specific factor 1-like isoform X2 [Phymastichus coffea]